MSKPLRLYVGGLQEHLKADQLAEAFRSFGVVSQVDIVPFKQLEHGSVDPGRCRGFAYLNLEPKDDGALSRCLSLYNGCKWRGNTLRVELAKPHYQLVLAKEAAEEVALAQRVDEQHHREAEAQHKAADAADGAEGAAPPDRALHVKALNILSPSGKKAVPQGKVKRFFPPVKGTPVARLSWEPPPSPKTDKHKYFKAYGLATPAPREPRAAAQPPASSSEPASAKRKAEEIAGQPHKLAKVDQAMTQQLQPPLPRQQEAAPAKRSQLPVIATEPAPAKTAATSDAESEESDEQMPPVEFLSDSEELGAAQAKQKLAALPKQADLSRFDSDSDSEGLHTNEPSKRPSAVHKAGPSSAVAATAVLPRSDSEEELQGVPPAQDGVSASVGPGRKAKQDPNSLSRFNSDTDSDADQAALLEYCPTPLSEVAGEEEGTPEHATTAHPASPSQAVSKNQLEEGSSPEAGMACHWGMEEPSPQSAVLSGDSDPSLADDAASGSAEQGGTSSAATSMDAEVEALSAAEPISVSESDEQPPDQHALPHDTIAEQLADDCDDSQHAFSLPEQATGDQDDQGDAHVEGASADSLPASASEDEEAELDLVHAQPAQQAMEVRDGDVWEQYPELQGLTAGASFCRPADATAATARLQSEREGLMADWKRKRRAALKHVSVPKPAGKRKPR